MKNIPHGWDLSKLIYKTLSPSYPLASFPSVASTLSQHSNTSRPQLKDIHNLSITNMPCTISALTSVASLATPSPIPPETQAQPPPYRDPRETRRTKSTASPFPLPAPSFLPHQYTPSHPHPHHLHLHRYQASFTSRLGSINIDCIFDS